MRIARPDKDGKHQAQFNKNKKRILSSQDVCGICGKKVDKTLKYPHPLSPCIDHIIPIAKGGHPSDIDNLQLAHWCCNREKSDKILKTSYKNKDIQVESIGNRVLPHLIDWETYHTEV